MTGISKKCSVHFLDIIGKVQKYGALKQTQQKFIIDEVLDLARVSELEKEADKLLVDISDDLEKLVKCERK